MSKTNTLKQAAIRDLKYFEGRMLTLLNASSEAWEEYEKVSAEDPHSRAAYAAYGHWDWLVKEQHRLSPWLHMAQTKVESLR